MEKIRELRGKLAALEGILRELGSVAVAFSGGVDSTFLLRVAHDALGKGAVAVTASAASFPGRELEEAKAFCGSLGVEQVVFSFDPLAVEGFRRNPENRCYLCKREIFREILRIAGERGLAHVADGSNLDDCGDYRPGMQALAELSVQSPLRQAGLGKQEIRELSREMGLPTWDKPSFACLASRFPYGEEITREKLRRVEEAEQFLLAQGFRQARVRSHGDLARIEILPEAFGRLLELREEAAAALKSCGFRYVSMDLQGYRTGSMNDFIAHKSRSPSA